MEKKTYAESVGEKPFNWFEVLDNSQGKTIDWRELYNLSKRWVTCACGNLCDVIPRIEGGMPFDPRLQRLGMRFNDAIYNADRKEALIVLREIENRSIELIKEISLESK